MGSCSKPPAGTQDAELLIVRALDDMLVAYTIHDRKKLTVEDAGSGIIAALGEAGLVIVPRKPTKAMKIAGNRCHSGVSVELYRSESTIRLWRAMIEAATK